jgi:hypothetical protein
MLNIDTNTMTISITRGDSASITFGAVDRSGAAWNPTEGDETITFAVAKKWGGDPLMEITNPYNADPTIFWTINIEREDWLNEDGTDKFKFADYVFDVQVGTEFGDITIIGQTEDLEPTFKVLGEVAPE